MPNGVSCAYFAARNHIYGKKEHNVFKEGIAGIQTARTADSLTKATSRVVPGLDAVSDVLGKVANVAKKILYPLVVASGIYNTVTAKDKVKAGASNGCGIGTMILSETFAEKGLEKLNEKILKTEVVTNNKYAKVGWYVLKGAAYVCASMLGYSIGSKAGEKAVDTYRFNHPKMPKIDDNPNQKITPEQLFDDMKL